MPFLADEVKPPFSSISRPSLAEAVMDADISSRVHQRLSHVNRVDEGGQMIRERSAVFLLSSVNQENLLIFKQQMSFSGLFATLKTVFAIFATIQLFLGLDFRLSNK